MRNKGGAHPAFEDASRTGGLERLPRIVGRGLAVGDYDNDGRMEVLVVDSEGQPLLLHNETKAITDRWIGFQLVGAEHSSRNAYGALVTLTVGGRKLVRQCQPGGSYLSSSDVRVHFGLGVDGDRITSATIRWPDGSLQTLSNLTPGRYLTVREGETPH